MRYSLHVQQWKDCNQCFLHETRSRVVLARGTVPCDVLFIGEAPGQSEDALGQPFVGPAGKLLDHLIKRSRIELTVTYAMTNLAACIPLGEDGAKTEEPDPVSIEACAPRLEQFVHEVARPRLIVCVGLLAQHWIMGTVSKGVLRRHSLVDYECQRVAIAHPAYILRANLAQQSLLKQRCVVTLQTAVENLDA